MPSQNLPRFLASFFKLFLFSKLPMLSRLPPGTEFNNCSSQQWKTKLIPYGMFSYLTLTHWMSHVWQMSHGRPVWFLAQIRQAARFNQECNPHLQLSSLLVFLLPWLTLQVIPSEIACYKLSKKNSRGSFVTTRSTLSQISTVIDNDDIFHTFSVSYHNLDWTESSTGKTDQVSK